MVAVVDSEQVKTKNMDLDGRAVASRGSFLWLGPALLREKLRSRTPITSRWRAVWAPSLCLELGALIGFGSVDYRILYAGR